MTETKHDPGPTRTVRIVGVDVARAIAFVGMVVAHFVVSLRPDDPGWLQAVGDVADGRAAPLFCVLLGVGAGILVARSEQDHQLVRRGVVLFLLGLVIWPSVARVFLILPHYGVLLALVPLSRRFSTRWLLGGAAVAFLIPSTLMATLGEHGFRSGGQPESYAELTDVAYLVGNLAWTGGYPMVGWVGYVLVGLWLARQPLAHPLTAGRLAMVGAGLAATQPLAAAVLTGLGGGPDRAESGALGWSAFFDSTAHSNATAWYVVASGSAVVMIALCVLVTSHLERWAQPLVHLGQQALSAYLVHLVIGAVLFWDWRDRVEPSITVQFGVVAAVVLALCTASVLWSRRWRRGPVETVLRALAG